MTVLDDLVVTAPGIYTDMSNEAYHADPSLSSSGARKLLAPSCPALYKYERDNAEPYRKTFDIGNAAHKLALGVGPEIIVVPGKRWDTNAIKAELVEIRAAGHIPVKEDEHAELQAMAKALKAHPVAMALFSGGTAETSIFWRDERTDIARRARLDWLPVVGKRRMIIPDYKTAVSAEPGKFAKAAMDHGYHQQDPWYRDAVIAAGLADDPQFVFVVQEKSAPYLVTVCQLDDMAVDIGRHLNRRAIDTYAECTASSRWPGYSDEVEPISLPYFYTRPFEDLL